MLNFDKYRDEFEKRQGWAEREQTEKPAFQIWGEIAYTFGQGEKSARGLVEWLFSEYEPPLLENGDSLKPGDWIMVSDDDDVSVTWCKNRFVCYYNATFFVVDDSGSDSFNENGTNITGWKYARLPEDGE